MVKALVFALFLLGWGVGEGVAQTRADSAAVLLEAAEQLRLRGETAAARAVLQLIEERYAGTPAAAAVAARTAVLRRTPERERLGRTEVQVFGALYGAWLGVAVPLAVDSDSREAYGLGLLAGAPVGFLAARVYANARSPTEGQTRAVTFGGVWGTYMGVALAEVFDLGASECEPLPAPDVICGNSELSSTIWSGVAGGLVGIGAGALIARKPITAGTAATATLGGMWGTWFGFAASSLAELRGDDILIGTMIGGNASMLVLGLTAPDWGISESRARLISVGGLVGGLGGVGLLLIAQPASEKVQISLPLVGSIAGLGAAAILTRDGDGGGADGGGADGGGVDGRGAGSRDADSRGALINRDRGRWALDAPDARLVFRAGHDGTMRPAAYVPILSARF